MRKVEAGLMGTANSRLAMPAFACTTSASPNTTPIVTPGPSPRCHGSSNRSTRRRSPSRLRSLRRGRPLDLDFLFAIGGAVAVTLGLRQRRQRRLDELEVELVVLHRHLDRAAAHQLAEQQFL